MRQLSMRKGGQTGIHRCWANIVPTPAKCGATSARSWSPEVALSVEAVPTAAPSGVADAMEGRRAAG